MKLKNIIIVALCSSIALLVLNMMDYGGMFQNAEHVRFGYEEEYMGSQIVVLVPFQSTLTSIALIIYCFSFALFVWKLKAGVVHKMIVKIAFVVWCSATFIMTFNLLVSNFIGWTYCGLDLVSDTEAYWHQEGASEYPLLYMLLFNKLLSIIRYGGSNLLWILSYILMIPGFISVQKLNKAVSVLGVLTMIISLSFIGLRYYQLPVFVYWIQNICYITLFVVALKEYKNNKIPLKL